MRTQNWSLLAAMLLWLLPCLAAAQNTSAEKQYGPGVSDTEILLGQTMPYSGPVSSLAIEGIVEKAYFDMINERGGVRGRKIRLISLDDAYSPPKTVEQTRRLVEQDNVLAIFSSMGTPTNSAIQAYLNSKKVPQLFAASGASRFFDPAKSPWSIGGQMALRSEGAAYAKYIRNHLPNARIAVLYQNDDFGRDMLGGLKDELGEASAKMIVAETPYNASDVTVDSQILALKATGADVLLYFATPKFAAQAIRKAYELDWRPTRFLAVASAHVKSVLEPAGYEASKGLITVGDIQRLDDPNVDQEMRDYYAFMKKWVPNGHPEQNVEAQGYLLANLLVQILERCGDNLTRENLMKVTTSMKDVTVPLKLHGLKINTSPTDYRLIRMVEVRQFDGQKWVATGERSDM